MNRWHIENRKKYKARKVLHSACSEKKAEKHGDTQRNTGRRKETQITTKIQKHIPRNTEQIQNRHKQYRDIQKTCRQLLKHTKQCRTVQKTHRELSRSAENQ